MVFDDNKPIYLQISSNICDKILSNEFKAEDRIQSVRDLGAEIGVNPNTVARSYEKLTDAGIIYNKRGIGYFISENAKEIVLDNERTNFMEKDLPEFIKKAELLGINIKELL